MESARSRMSGDEWTVVRGLLPVGWEAAARTLGAMRRARGIASAEALLRTLLAHVADGCSLKETSLRVRQAGWGQLSPVALFKRLRASEQWLRWIANQLWSGRQASTVAGFSGRVLATDGTVVRESGPTGSLWRVHWSIHLADLQCEHFELTDVHGGESFRRTPIRQGDLVLGDRCYGTPPGIADVIRRGGDVLVRVNSASLPLYDRSHRRMKLLPRLRRLEIGKAASFNALVRDPQGRWIAGRLVAMRRTRAATMQVRRKLRRRAQRKQQQLRRSTLELAGYVLIWTSLTPQEAPTAMVLRLYRLRWQIELAFKRMKSILGLGQLPKRSDPSSRAWLHGKLLAALLLEKLWQQAEHFSPWGYTLESQTEPLAGNEIPAS